jgi:integrase
MIAKARRASATGATITHDDLTPALIKFLADYYLATELADDEQMRWGRPPLKPRYASRPDIEQDYEDSREMLSGYRGDALQTLWGTWAVEYASAMGYSLDPAGPAFGKLLEAIASAACHLWLAIDSRRDAAKGESSPIGTPPMPEPPYVADKAADGTSDTKSSFEDIAQGILDSSRQNISVSSKESAATALRFFREAHGNPTPAKITRAMVAEWLNLMEQRPSRLPANHRALPLREVVDLYQGRDEVKRLTAKTYDGHASALAALWTKAAKAGQIRDDRANPFGGHRVASTAPQPEEPKGFSGEELAAMFALPIFTKGERPKGGKGHASYWMPLIMLWTGSRPEEAAQLMVDDFREVAGSGWTMTYTDLGIHPHKGQRSLKTSRKRSGRRTIPVPQALLDLGLIAYITHLRTSGEKALFPLLKTKSARKLLATAWDDWWRDLVYARGILVKGVGRQPAREFRHTWTTAARASEIPREVREYAQGHKAAGGTANEGYGDLAPLGRQLARLRFEGLDLSGVKIWVP